jgi:hypothetical protein
VELNFLETQALHFLRLSTSFWPLVFKSNSVLNRLNVSLSFLVIIVPMNVWADFPRLPAVGLVEIFVRESLKPEQERYYRDGVLYYLGVIKGNRAHGKGKLFWKNGRVRYDGDFIEGRLEGAGKLFDHEGLLLYKGEFRVGVFARGSYFNAVGEVMYEGDFPPPPLLQH